MAISFSISHTDLITFIYLLLLSSTSAHNITTILSSFQNLTSFSSLLSSTSVASDITRRDPITVLVVPNSYLSTYPSSDLTRRLPPSSIGDILRYHVLLQYFSPSDLRKIPPSGVLVTTLLQTTGRAHSNSGSVNITRNILTNAITIQSLAPFSQSSNVSVLSLIKTFPYNITILAVDSLLVPYDSDLMASETRPPLGLNITKALLDGHNFNVAASMLAASGVVDEFEADEGGAGITLFVPTDKAYADLPGNVRLQSLPADKKAVVLKFHVLHSYYPLGSLELIVNPVQPTLATEDNGAGSFTLNISRVNGSELLIDTGIVQASVTQTVIDQNPVAIFGVSKVLLPREFFGKDQAVVTKPVNAVVGTTVQSPEISPSPGNSAGFSSPQGFREEITSDGVRYRLQSCIVALCCIGLYLVVGA